MALSDSQSACPHFDQVRLIAYHHIQAKGPMHARSLVRKVLGNEEFCMQIDAHTDFAVGWDDLALSEWKNTHNEFGILSNVPVATTDKAAYSTDGEKFTEVPRQCAIRFLDNGFPVCGFILSVKTLLLSFGGYFLTLSSACPPGLLQTGRW